MSNATRGGVAGRLVVAGFEVAGAVAGVVIVGIAAGFEADLSGG